MIFRKTAIITKQSPLNQKWRDSYTVASRCIFLIIWGLRFEISCSYQSSIFTNMELRSLITRPSSRKEEKKLRLILLEGSSTFYIKRNVQPAARVLVPLQTEESKCLFVCTVSDRYCTFKANLTVVLRS